MILSKIKHLLRRVAVFWQRAYKDMPVLVLKKPTPGCQPVKLNRAVQWLLQHPHFGVDSTRQLHEHYKADASLAAQEESRRISLSHFKRAVKQAKEISCGAAAPQSTDSVIIPACKELENKLFSKEVLPSLLPILVSFDTAEVPVWIQGSADAPAEQVRLHVAGAISSEGCWMYNTKLADIHEAPGGDNYHTGDFLEVLPKLQEAVENGSMPLQKRSAKAIAGLAALLHSWQQHEGEGKVSGAAAQPGRAQAARGQQGWRTQHYRCRTRGAGRAANIQGNLGRVCARGWQLRPYVLLLDGASQHTSAPTVQALQRTGQSAIHVVSRHNPIELLWVDLKKAAAQQQYTSEKHAMQGLVELWSSMAGEAAAAMQQWRAPTK